MRRSLALEGDDALAAVKDALSVYSVDPEITVRLTRLGPDGVLRAYTGPLIESWKLPDAGSRTRVGARRAWAWRCRSVDAGRESSARAAESRRRHSRRRISMRRSSLVPCGGASSAAMRYRL